MPEQTTRDNFSLEDIKVTKDLTQDEYAGARLFSMHFGCASEKGMEKVVGLAGRKVGGLVGGAFTFEDLVENGLVAKMADGFYILTDRGTAAVEKLKEHDESWEDLFEAVQQARKERAEHAFNEMVATFDYGGDATRRIVQLVAIGKKGECDNAIAAKLFDSKDFVYSYDFGELVSLDLLILDADGKVRLSQIGDEVYRRLINNEMVEKEAMDSLIAQANALVGPELRTVSA